MPGLRRREVAALGDMSVEYYAELERGNLPGVSPAVMEPSPAPSGWTTPNLPTC
ncbi:helix-turn-helix domain-containing protein [Herbidospora yilanensis]|uniref:helix-turn-helix domain-containing protein n=1 Tax=Herbidospora yilanensis TaxID=354426 RepID=UPI001E43A100|nr:helix-turn-helix domain-containing protein [Herbidospora yilanensis]